MILQPILSWWIVAIIFGSMLVAVGLLIRRSTSAAQRKAWVTRGVLVLLLLIIALRPSLAGGVTSAGATNFDVIVAVDYTASMFAEDYDGFANRMEAARQDAKDLAHRLAGARISLVVFASGARTTVPLTSDIAAFDSAVDTITQEITTFSHGSSIDAPLSILRDNLKTAQQAHPERQRLVFYMGDGEQTSSKKPISFASLAQYIDGGGVLGYGTDTGGKMPEGQYGDYVAAKESFIRDKAGKIALSKIDESNLQRLASDMQVTYTHMSPEVAVDAMIEDGGTAQLQKDSQNVAGYIELYWVAALGIFALLSYEFIQVGRQLRAVTTKKGHK